MILRIIVACILWSMPQLYGQSITIIDNEKNPVPFASVLCERMQIGGYADEKGLFQLPPNIIVGDTLLISSIGYKKHITPYNGEKEIILQSLTTNLSQVVISPKGNEITLGAKKKQSHFVASVNHPKQRSEIGLLLNNKREKAGKVISVSFYINGLNKPRTPFRIRIYSVTDDKPDKDLLLENIVVKGERKGGWLEINIEKYNVPFPEDGIVVSMESLYGFKKTSFYSTKNITTGKIETEYGQSLGLTDEFETAIAYQRNLNGTWAPFSVKFPSNISSAVFYPMIQIKIKTDE